MWSIIYENLRCNNIGIESMLTQFMLKLNKYATCALYQILKPYSRNEKLHGFLDLPISNIFAPTLNLPKFSISNQIPTYSLFLSSG